MATTTRRMATEADLLAMPEDGRKYELVDVVSPGDRPRYILDKVGEYLRFR